MSAKVDVVAVLPGLERAATVREVAGAAEYMAVDEHHARAFRRWELEAQLGGVHGEGTLAALGAGVGALVRE